MQIVNEVKTVLLTRQEISHCLSLRFTECGRPFPIVLAFTLLSLRRIVKINPIVAVQIDSTICCATIEKLIIVKMHILALGFKNARLLVLIFDVSGTVDIHSRNE